MTAPTETDQSDSLSEAQVRQGGCANAREAAQSGSAFYGVDSRGEGALHSGASFQSGNVGEGEATRI